MNFHIEHAKNLLSKPEPTRQDVNAAKTALAIWLHDYDKQSEDRGQ